MSSASVLAMLRARGCDEEVIAHGWDLLRRANGVRLVKARNPAVLPASARLAALQSTWIPIADATLEARFPAVHETVFRNLGPGSGPDMYVAMQTFHDRVAGLYVSEDATDREAAELLDRRGLGQATLTEIAEAIEHFKVLDAEVNDVSEIEKAEQELATFYREWSKIVRSTVKDKRLLLAMGFLRKPRASKKPEAGAPAKTPEAPAAPVTTETVAKTNPV